MPRKYKHGDFIEELDYTSAIFRDSDDVALWLRVGTVFNGHFVRTPGDDYVHVCDESKEPGIWIEMQEEYYKSDLRGPFLMSFALFRKVAKYIEEHFGKPIFDKCPHCSKRVRRDRK